MKEHDKKMTTCKYSFPDIIPDKEKGITLRNFCAKDNEKRYITEQECLKCNCYSNKYIEYPITINKIETRETNPPDSNCGKLVKIAPCAEEYQDKTFLGLYLGKFPIAPIISHDNNSGTLYITPMENPAIYVPELQKVIFGAESWWSFINPEDGLKEFPENKDFINSIKNKK